MPIVETKRLLLRPMEEEDVCDVFAYFQSGLVMKYLSLQPHTTIDQTLHGLRTYTLAYEKRGVPQTWAIVYQNEDKVIGSLEIHSMEDDIGEIGYVLHPDYWSQGIMSEALPQLLKVGFEHLGLRRIEALYAVGHHVSGKLLHRCGFHEEGILRSYAKLSDGLYHDMRITSILKDEFVFK